MFSADFPDFASLGISRDGDGGGERQLGCKSGSHSVDSSSSKEDSLSSSVSVDQSNLQRGCKRRTACDTFFSLSSFPSIGQGGGREEGTVGGSNTIKKIETQRQDYVGARGGGGRGRRARRLNLSRDGIEAE